MEPDAIPVRGSRLRRSIVKREAPYVIYPEILVIVDYDGYRYEVLPKNHLEITI